LVDICGYELPKKLQNFMEKDLTEMKIFLKVLGGGLLFLKHPVHDGKKVNTDNNKYKKNLTTALN